MAEPAAEPPASRGQAFARSVVTLASGTAIAQLLLVLAVPALTRLYTPADYGALAVYSSTLTVLAESVTSPSTTSTEAGRIPRARSADRASARTRWPSFTNASNR